MSTLIGQSGSITVGSTVVTVKEHNITFENDVQDVTDTGSAGWAAKIAGINSASGSFTAFWGANAATLNTVFAIGTVISASFAIGNSMHAISGSWIIKSFSIKNDAKQVVEFSCSIESTGSITVS